LLFFLPVSNSFKWKYSFSGSQTHQTSLTCTFLLNAEHWLTSRPWRRRERMIYFNAFMEKTKGLYMHCIYTLNKTKRLSYYRSSRIFFLELIYKINDKSWSSIWTWQIKMYHYIQKTFIFCHRRVFIFFISWRMLFTLSSHHEPVSKLLFVFIIFGFSFVLSSIIQWYYLYCFRSNEAFIKKKLCCRFSNDEFEFKRARSV
jgi:hypothetical protein